MKLRENKRKPPTGIDHSFKWIHAQKGGIDSSNILNQPQNTTLAEEQEPYHENLLNSNGWEFSLMGS